MKIGILVKMVSAALLMAHSIASKASSKATTTTSASVTATASAAAGSEARSGLHRHGKTLYICGGFLNHEDISLALEGLSSLFGPDRKSLSQFPSGRHLDKVVYTHNTAQAYVCSRNYGKFANIGSEDIVENVNGIRKECGGVLSSTGELWLPDLDYCIGFGRINEATCEPKNLRKTWGSMVGLV